MISNSPTPRGPERGSWGKFAAYTIGGIALGELCMGIAYTLEPGNPPWQPFALTGLVVGAPVGMLGYAARNTRFVRGMIDELIK